MAGHFGHLNQYISDITQISRVHATTSAIEFWHHKYRTKIYSVLPLIAQDYVSAPDSQVFVESVQYFYCWQTKQNGKVTQLACLAESQPLWTGRPWELFLMTVWNSFLYPKKLYFDWTELHKWLIGRSNILSYEKLKLKLYNIKTKMIIGKVNKNLNYYSFEN